MGDTADTKAEFTNVTEGRANILFPKDQVFYNPAQQFNRDLSVSVIKTYSESLTTKKQLAKAAWEERKAKEGGQPSAEESTANGPTQRKVQVLEALSASGLRAIRYALELPAVSTVYANDMDPSAIEAIHRNINHNNVPRDLIKVSQLDANILMYSHRTDRVDVIDLDPYGTATPFIDAAIQAVSSDGLLCVTCTDMAVSAGIGYPEKCYANYGGMPAKQEYTHEVAVRLILNSIALTAAKYGRAIEPLLCLSIDFYVRLFLLVKQSPAQVKHLASNTMITYNCTGCGSWSNQHLGRTSEKGEQTKFQLNSGPSTDSLCKHCGYRQMLAGPMWAGPLHNRPFLEKLQQTIQSLDESVYKTRPRMLGMLSLASEELDVPFYRTSQDLARTLKSQTPPLDVVWSALTNAGYKVSSTHCVAGGFKTDAPMDVIWDMMRAWVKVNPVRMDRVKENSPGYKILTTPSTNEIDLTIRKDVNPNRTKIARYVQVPPNSGPGTKAGKKEGRSWRGKRKRDVNDTGSDGKEAESDAVAEDVKMQS